MSRWFRFHAEALDDPKVQLLDGDTFKAWVNLLCLASRNDGFLPGIEDVAFALRVDANGARTLVERLLNATLIDKLTGGSNGYRYAPHGWHKRQYKSDTSTERVKRFRQRSEPVSETPPETDTETESSVAKATGASADPIKELFDVGVAVLTAAGQTEKEARSLIGKWRKEQKSDGKVLTALLDCRGKTISNPIEWLSKRLAGAQYISASGYEYRGDWDAVQREAKRRGDNDTYWRVEVDRKSQAASQAA